MQIDTSVAEADVGGVAEGQSVEFTVDAYPTRTFHGTVTQVRNSPTTVNNVVTYDCVIGVTNSDYKLKPGMTANVSIIVAQRENALIIPNGALHFRPPEDAVLMTNSSPAQTAQGTNGGNFARGPHLYRRADRSDDDVVPFCLGGFGKFFQPPHDNTRDSRHDETGDNGQDGEEQVIVHTRILMLQGGK